MELELPAVPKRVVAFDARLGAALASALLAGNGARALEWAEKLRRFVEVNRADLRAVSRKRFGESQYRPALAAMADVLCAAAVRGGAGTRPDLVFLNAAMWALDIAQVTPQTVTAPSERTPGAFAQTIADNALARLQTSPLEDEKSLVELAPVWAVQESPKLPEFNSFGVVVFCPQPRSLYSLSTLALLARQRIPVRAIVIRKLGARRFFQEFRRDGLRLFRKVWRKLILQSSESHGGSGETLLTLAKSLGVAGTGIRQYAKQAGIVCRMADDFDDAEVVALLKDAKPSCVVFTGGGLIGEQTLANSGLGVINCHMGILPQYKGMDVVQWPLLEGVHDQIGATTHLMMKGIDTGPILHGIRIRPEGYKSLAALRNQVERNMPQLMCDTVVGLREGTLVPRAQQPGGRQYFQLHPKLEAVLPAMFMYIERSTEGKSP